MSTEEEFPVAICKAGQSAEVSAVIVTPTQTGRHTAVFRLADADRVPFGPRLWCDIVVPDLSGAATEQPVPSAPPASGLPVPTAPTPASLSETKEPSKAEKEKPKEEPKDAQEKYAIQMRALSSMGFKNEALNKFLLESHDGNVQKVCEYLLQNLR